MNCQPGLARFIARAGNRGVAWQPLPGRSHGNHDDAVHRAGGDAELTTGAPARQSRVHQARGADNGIDRAGLDAERTADAVRLIDDGDFNGPVGAAFRIQREYVAFKQSGELDDPGRATRRAAIDRRFAAGNRVSVGPASRIAALRALRLGKQVVDAFGKSRHGTGDRL